MIIVAYKRETKGLKIRVCTGVSLYSLVETR